MGSPSLVVNTSQGNGSSPAANAGAVLLGCEGKGEMKRLVVTTYLMIALIGPTLAQDVAAVGKKAKPKQSSECRPVGTVKGTKLWAGNCVAPDAMAAPVAEPESEPETTGAIRGGKE